MEKWKYYTPDGVADILPKECKQKREIEKKIRDYFAINGYEEIETPGLEFFDVYSAGEGFAPQEGMFKFFDHQGRILSLRYDGTIPVARVASTLLKEATPPLRLSYIGNMYRYNETGGGKQREFTQAGVELLGPINPLADAQIIAMAIESALLLGIKDLQVSLGNVEFFKGILEEWGINSEFAKNLPNLIDSKETIAIENFSNQLKLPKEATKVLLKMTSSFGTFDLIDEMKQLVSNKRSLDALENLNEVLSILDEMNLLEYVSLDLGMLQSLNYYTGIIFKGFTYGIGFPLFSGGRYDNVASEFGRNLPSTGFSIGINFVMNALQRQNIDNYVTKDKLLLCFDKSQRQKALQLANKKRSEDNIVELDCMGLSEAQAFEYAKENNFSNAIYIGSNGENLNLLKQGEK